MLAFIGYVYLSFVALTSRIRVNPIAPGSHESLITLRQRAPAVYAFWFEHIVFLLYYFGARQMPILMTPQGKTDRMTRLSEWMGLKVAKGSLEGGGRHALVTLLEQAKAGNAIAIAADGSRGPVRRCKAGCFIIAQESGAPIIPVAWKATLSIRIPRKYGPLLLPLPFNSIEIRVGSPLPVNKHHQFNELENVKILLAKQLDALDA